MTIQLSQTATLTKSHNFRDEGPYHIETSQLICSANQWTGSYMIGTAVIQECNP